MFVRHPCRVLAKSGLSLKDNLPGESVTLGEALMVPTVIYVKQVTPHIWFTYNCRLYLKVAIIIIRFCKSRCLILSAREVSKESPTSRAVVLRIISLVCFQRVSEL